jgi:ParB-like chromosome segregation protein Spo0J
MSSLFLTLDDGTEAALRASIERFGVISPVLYDQHGELVDGANRTRIAAELSVEFPRVEIVLPDDDDERRAALVSLNNDRRQRMEPEQRREVVKALREDGHSQRAIAGALGVDPMTVNRDLKESVESSTPDRILGRDGKSYPAKNRQPDVYYGKGDKFDDSVQPVRRYLRAWAKRDYRFEHVAPKEARRRLKALHEMADGIAAAITDLEGRSQDARLRVTGGI